jgi:hypothetical protein
MAQIIQQNDQTKLCSFYNDRLADAVSRRDKAKILELYEAYETVCFDHVSEEVANEYDDLVDKGNDIIYS